MAHVRFDSTDSVFMIQRVRNFSERTSSNDPRTFHSIRCGGSPDREAAKLPWTCHPCKSVGRSRFNSRLSVTKRKTDPTVGLIPSEYTGHPTLKYSRAT